MGQAEIAISVLLVLSGITPTNGNDAACGSFSSSAWRNAPNQDSQNWSRQRLLAGLPSLEQIRQRDRATIIAQLRVPGTSNELYTPGAGRYGRLDIYRLSAKNDRVLRVDYDAQDRLESDATETSSCGCPLCLQASRDSNAIIPTDVLVRTVLKAGDVNATVMSKRRVEGLLGHAGWPYSTIEQIGGQAWSDYGEIWRVAGTANRFFLTSGQMTVVNRTARQDAELPITSFAIVTVGPECASS